MREKVCAVYLNDKLPPYEQQRVEILISPPPLTVYYTNVRGLWGNFTDLEAFMLKNNPDIFALCETNLHDDIQDPDFQLSGYLSIHRKDAGHMHDLGVYVKSNLPIARETILEDENEAYMCFRLALQHSTIFIFFLHRSPSSSSNIDKALILQPSANMMGDFNAHNTEWLIPIPLMPQVCFVKSFLWNKTSPRLLNSILAFLTVMIISHIFFTYSNLALLLLILLWENLTIW